MIICPRCQAENPDGVSLCSRCSSLLAALPQTSAPSLASDPIGSLIPTKNAPALSAYYLGLFSIFPFFGLLMGIFALVFGIRGLKLVKANPQVKGKAHAGIGIGCGSIGLLFNILIVAGLVIAATQRKP